MGQPLPEARPPLRHGAAAASTTLPDTISAGMRHLRLGLVTAVGARLPEAGRQGGRWSGLVRDGGGGGRCGRPTAFLPLLQLAACVQSTARLALGSWRRGNQAFCSED